MTASGWLRLVAVVVVGLVFQVAVLDDITVFGAHPDVMILIAACAGMAAGSQRGAIAGFLAGLAADLVVNLPYGLSSLTFVLVGFGTGLLQANIAARDVESTQAAVCVAASAAGTLLYALLGALTGRSGLLGLGTVYAVVVVTLGAIVLSWPALRCLRWVFAGSRARLGLVVPRGGSAVR
ncbi:MAG TPA: rod shape-determining protein MreD [Acidimicrobiales bacterium]|nr:rod shape-determining protein MreD [Acidimicrobiales bacterium]